MFDFGASSPWASVEHGGGDRELRGKRANLMPVQARLFLEVLAFMAAALLSAGDSWAALPGKNGRIASATGFLTRPTVVMRCTAEVEQVADKRTLGELMDRLAAGEPVVLDEPPEVTIRHFRDAG
jgi:hypothetical protein